MWWRDSDNCVYDSYSGTSISTLNFGRPLDVFIGCIHYSRRCPWRPCRAWTSQVHSRRRSKYLWINSTDFNFWSWTTSYRITLRSSMVTILFFLINILSEPYQNVVYNAFTRYGKSSSWCKAHSLSFRALSRAVSIRSQLKKYMQRFSLPIESCEGDAKRLRQCLVSGYWKHGARWVADGTYRSVRGNAVSFVSMANLRSDIDGDPLHS